MHNFSTYTDPYGLWKHLRLCSFFFRFSTGFFWYHNLARSNFTQLLFSHRFRTSLIGFIWGTKASLLLVGTITFSVDVFSYYDFRSVHQNLAAEKPLGEQCYIYIGTYIYIQILQKLFIISYSPIHNISIYGNFKLIGVYVRYYKTA